MKRRTKSTLLVIVAVIIVAALAVSSVRAYCLTGVRWPDGARPAPMYYNSKGKLGTGQCISSSQMDDAVKNGVTVWKAIAWAGATTATANKRDGKNVLGWANLGGSTLGITNYLSYDRYRTVPCGSNYFANLYEVDVRFTTQYRWTSGQGGCPCAAGSAIYLNSVSAHENGHVIGLCHVNDPKALMYPSTGVCENKGKTSDETAGENALCY
jgi:hypothetical protein